MLATFSVPILSVTAEAVRDLQGQDALCGLWTVFTKCKGSVQDGRRLENISWRLWYRELIQPQLASPRRATPHPKDERCRSSYFVTTTNEKVSLKLEVLSSGLPSPSDQASPSPLPPLMPSMVPPSTPERPRISPHLSGSSIPPSTSPRGKSTPCVGRVIVDMLPNQITVPQRKPVPAATTTLAAPLPSPSCDLSVPLVQLPASGGEPPFPRVVVVNPTPHPTPPTTPILHDDVPGAPQPPSMFLLPPLPPPALRPSAPSAELKGRLSSQPPRLPDPSLSPTPVRPTDDTSMARQSDRRFFLQQSPENVSPEIGDGSTASGKSPSDMFEGSSPASSQVKSVSTDVDGENDKREDHEEEEDQRSATAADGAGARHATQCCRQNKAKKGKEVGKRPMIKRAHSAKHVAPSLVKKLSTQQQPHPQTERTEKKGAMFNFGSGSSNGSRSANGSTDKDKGNARPCPVVNGFTTIQPPPKVSSPQVHPPVIPNGLANGHVVAGNHGLNGNPSVNGNAKANSTDKVNGNVNGNTQSRKTIVVANSSSDYETTDGEDSEWASEEMDTEDKARQAEETRLREAALEVQRQRELFAKVPKRSYSNLNRTQSGLLSQLMNPNPAIFPLNHPYRVTRSSADIPRQYLPQQRAPVPQRSTSAYAPPRLSTSKSSAALPLAAQITAISSSRSDAPSATKRKESEKNGYRPKGPPNEQEMEDDSGDDADDKIQVSESVAHKRLQALMSRKSSEHGATSHLIQPVATETGPGLLSMHTAPIPLGHPYNLPVAPAPMTPRTTRRRMLKTELSESMRRQLLWERQVSSNNNPALVARRATQGVRPMTSNSAEAVRDPSTRSAEAQDKDERKRRAMARNRSWADDYHYSGW